MKSLYLFLFSVLSIGNIQAQTNAGRGGGVFLKDANGNQVFTATGNLKIEGNPFFPTEYCTANLKIAGGKWFEGLKVKLYLIDNSVYFLGENSTDKVVDMQVQKIDFISCDEGGKGAGTSFQSGFSAIDKQNEKTFYELLDSGKTKLLKYYEVTYSDERPFNTSGITRIFKTSETLYASLPANKMVKLTKSKEAIISVLQDKQVLIETFINTQKINCKKEKDIIKVFNYYNTL